MKNHFKWEYKLKDTPVSLLPICGKLRHIPKGKDLGELLEKVFGFNLIFWLLSTKALPLQFPLQTSENKEGPLTSVVIWSLSAVSAVSEEMRKITNWITLNNLILYLSMVTWESIAWLARDLSSVIYIVSAILPTGQVSSRVQDPASSGN